MPCLLDDTYSMTKEKISFPELLGKLYEKPFIKYDNCDAMFFLVRLWQIN